MGFIVALLAYVQASADVGTTVIGNWNDQIVNAWYTAVSYWYGLNGW